MIFLLIGFILWKNKIYEKGTIVCTYTGINDLYKIHTEYQINYKKDIVNYLETTETIESNDKKMLEKYQINLHMIYDEYNSLDNYKNMIHLENNKLTSITKINYAKLDIKEWININQNNKDLLEKNHVSLNKLKQIYQNNGANCHYR